MGRMAFLSLRQFRISTAKCSTYSLILQVSMRRELWSLRFQSRFGFESYNSIAVLDLYCDPKSHIILHASFSLAIKSQFFLMSMVKLKSINVRECLETPMQDAIQIKRTSLF